MNTVIEEQNIAPVEQTAEQKIALEKVRSYENEKKAMVDEQRPVFHVTPPTGWMNDPNGFSIYKNEYHLFFQYYPYDTIWGSMHWGHVKTKDFIRWEHLPAALAPDQPYDETGCFSGAAIELPDGRQLILYSGVTPYNYMKEPHVADLNRDYDLYQNQCLAIGDGVNYKKSDENPILLANTVPEGGSLVDFRDPKIWKEDDRYYAVISNRPASGLGDILLYESDDCMHWNYRSTVISNNGTYGKMWECPDVFTLDDRDVLLVSPMEMVEQDLEYHNGHITMAIFGTFDKESGKFIEDSNHAIDYGIDFYSTQSLLTEDGRRIMIAWMANWKEQEVRYEGLHFFGQMTTPRELHVVNDRLIQNPVREIENYRCNKVVHENVHFTDDSYHTLEGIKGRVMDLTIELEAKDKIYKEFEIQLAQDEQHHLSISYSPETSIVTVDRSKCGENQKDLEIGKFYVRNRQGALKLRILLDKYSVELFANDGEQAATYLFYTDLAVDGIRFRCEGNVVLNLEKYDIV